MAIYRIDIFITAAVKEQKQYGWPIPEKRFAAISNPQEAQEVT